MLDIYANFIGLVVQFQGISIQWTATAWRANSLHQRNNKRFEALFLEYLLPGKFAWISLMFSTFQVRQTTNFAIASTNGPCLSRQQTLAKIIRFLSFSRQNVLKTLLLDFNPAGLLPYGSVNSKPRTFTPFAPGIEKENLTFFFFHKEANAPSWGSWSRQKSPRCGENSPNTSSVG